MLSIFTIPKPFQGHIGLIQRNALASWRRLEPSCEILLFGNDEGVAAAAEETGGRHIAELPANAYGTPLVSEAFRIAAREASTPFLMYANSDMLFDASLPDALAAVRDHERFLLCGRRWDRDITVSLVGATESGWAEAFRRDSRTGGSMHGPAGMDYFIFSRAMPLSMPPFAVGRVGWDNWLVWNCRITGVPVIDATGTVAAIHQNHDYAALKLGRQHECGPERDLNIHAAGGLGHMLTLREADWHLVRGRLQRPPFPQRLLALAAPTRPYQAFLIVKRRFF